MILVSIIDEADLPEALLCDAAAQRCPFVREEASMAALDEADLPEALLCDAAAQRCPVVRGEASMAALDEADLPEALVCDAAAQRCPVVRYPRLLSATEVAEIHAFVVEEGAACGTARKCADPVTGAAAWETTYLSTDLRFQRRFPALLAKLLDAARRADAAWFGGFARGVAVRPRVVEYHRVRRTGELRHAEHYDSGSVYTVDCMLSQPDEDFAGGDFAAEGPWAPEGGGRAFEDLGDVIVFASHKRHNVKPVARGERRVLVVEFWRGEERACGHRCERATGACAVRPVSAVIAASLADLAPEDQRSALAFLRGRTVF